MWSSSSSSGSVPCELAKVTVFKQLVIPLNAKLNPICHLLALLGAHHILHISRIRVNTRFWIFRLALTAFFKWLYFFSHLNDQLNPICHLLALLGAHHILHISRIRVNTRLWIFRLALTAFFKWSYFFSPLNNQLNPFCHLVALLGAHHILYVSRIRVKIHPCG